MSWRAKLFVLLLGFSLAPTAFVTLVGLRSLGQTFEDSTLDSLEALARAKAEAIGQFTDIRRRDVEQIATLVGPRLARLQAARGVRPEEKPPASDLPDLEDAEKRPPPEAPSVAEDAPAEEPPVEEPEQQPAEDETPSPQVEAASAELDKVLGLLLWDQSDFEELLVIDTEGRVIASTFDDHERKNAASVAYFEYGRKATYVQPVFRSPITDKLTMVISTPIRNEDGNGIGVLAARLNLRRFFRLINDFTGLGSTGETVVAKKIDENLVFMAPTRHDDEAALERKLPAKRSQRGNALAEAARGHSGSGEVLDYRGVRVLAAWTFVPSLEWGLVSKIDVEEATKAVNDTALQIVLLVSALAVLVVLASLLVSRSLVRPLRDLRTATERISKGDFDVTLDIRSGDELGELADSFERMVAAIKFFREHARSEDEERAVDEDVPEGAEDGDVPPDSGR